MGYFLVLQDFLVVHSLFSSATLRILLNRPSTKREVC